VDLFAGCLDQVGLLEMKSLPNSTNGVMVLSDSFATSIFKQSFLRMFNKDDQDQLEMGFNATFDVQVNLSETFVGGRWILTAEYRPPKNSRSLVLSGTPSLPGKRVLVSARPRSVSVRRPLGNSTQSPHVLQPPSISKSLLPPDNPCNQALEDSSNSLPTISTRLASKDFV
jgi:hypothetical protein